MADVLFLAAFHPELAPFRALLGDEMTGRVFGVDVAARVVGIGLAAAAAGAAAQLIQLRPRVVVMVGTCGAYVGAGPEVGEVVVGRRTQLVDPSALSDLAQFPEPMILSRTHPASLVVTMAAAGARDVQVATTLAITVDDSSAQRISRATGAHVEHLEAYGAATACDALGVPFVPLLGVANWVGRRAREQWRIHHQRAAVAPVDCAARWLRAGVQI